MRGIHQRLAMPHCQAADHPREAAEQVAGMAAVTLEEANLPQIQRQRKEFP